MSDRVIIGTVEDGAITCIWIGFNYDAVYNGSLVLLTVFPQFALWATNMASALPTRKIRENGIEIDRTLRLPYPYIEQNVLILDLRAAVACGKGV